MNKKYKVRFALKAQKDLKKMDPNTAKIIMAWINKNLEDCENPFLYAGPLQGDLKDKWRYRIGHYRIICTINDEAIIILVLKVGHRRNIYE